MAYFVYILESLRDGTYYVGSTNNLSDRLERHNQGRSRYTKVKRPWILVFSEKFPDRSAAVKREQEIKRRKSSDYIEGLVRASRHTWREGREFKSRHSRHFEISLSYKWWAFLLWVILYISFEVAGTAAIMWAPHKILKSGWSDITKAGRSIRRTEVPGRLYILRNIQKEVMRLSVRMLSRIAKAVIT